VVATAGCDIAMADHKEQATAEWRKTYALSAGGRVEIANVNGKIQVLPASGNAVEVVAKKIGRGASQEAAKESLERVEIRESQSEGVVKVETHLQRAAGLFTHNNASVEYTVRVPASAEVKASTVNGGVEINGVEGRVIAETTNGGIEARGIAGPIDASTTNGGVDVELTRVADAGVRLECTNGGITLRLPADARASVSARVLNGGIDTGNLPLKTRGETSRRRLDGDLNGGGPRITLEGTNGGITLVAR
jgi:DUF4097 and DUF4098 domain-containing protein YvlB